MISIYVNNDLDMPIGKVAAQVSHSLGMKLMELCSVLSEDNDTVRLQVHDHGLFLGKTELEIIDQINLNFVSGDEFNSHATDISTVTVIDNGLTCFNNQKTPTVVLKCSQGEVQNEGLRLQFDVDKGCDFKQGLFVDRNAFSSEEILVVTTAVASLKKMLVDLVDDENNLTIEKSSPWFGWLTTAFGKTVVGTKKNSKFLEVKEQMETLGWSCLESDCCGVIATVPMKSDELQKLTRYKSFRLI